MYRFCLLDKTYKILNTFDSDDNSFFFFIFYYNFIVININICQATLYISQISAETFKRTW